MLLDIVGDVILRQRKYNMSNKLIVASVLSAMLGGACFNTEAMRESPRGTSAGSNFDVIRIPSECIIQDSEGYSLDVNALAPILQPVVQRWACVNQAEYENKIVVAEFKFVKGFRVADGEELSITGSGIGDCMLEILKKHGFAQQKGLFDNEKNQLNAVRDGLGWAITLKDGRTWAQFGLKERGGKLFVQGRDFE
ncbi:MAG: hypothetical protein IJA14_05275, partial [Alphaproteobacteria bacterium]|nr:hypothetical protein [Alphaproteobacteria bacterium]